MRRARVVAAVVVACAQGACDGPHPRDHTAREITNGSEDGDHPGVVAVGTRRTFCDSGLAVQCTGTLIAPRVVLSAAHCFFGGDPAARFEVRFGASSADPAVTYRQVVEIALHPSFDPDTNHADLALLLLEAPVEIAAIPLAAELPAPTPIGAEVQLVGFGDTRVADDLPGIKRVGTATIASWDAAEFRVGPGPSMTCHGDSGGPVLLGDPGSEVLLGVTSSGDPGCAEYGDNTRVDVFTEEFIAPFVAAADASTLPAPIIDVADVCVAECASDEECPDGMVCRVDSRDPRCVLASQPVGALVEACVDNTDCPACMRLRADDGEGACRCMRECEVTDGGGDGGCQLAGAAVGSARCAPLPLFAGVGLGLLLLCRRRARARQHRFRVRRPDARASGARGRQPRTL